LYADYNEPAYKLYWDRIGVDGNNDGVVDQNPWERRGQGNEILNTEPLAINVGGLNGGYYSDLYYEMALNYANTFGQHSVTAMALLNRQQKNRELEFPYYNEALAGRATYDYSRKYLLELNIGYTGSERFAPKNRFGFFPAGAVGWVVSEESFFKNAVPWMSKLKLRYSDGLVGSDYASSRWLYISQYYASGNFINEDQGANLSAQWEEARKRDVGLELGFFKNTLTFNVDLFDEQRTKMLLAPRTVTFLVGSSFKDLNLGALKKHGIEFEAEYRKTTASNISYFVKGLFGYNENRIIYKDDLPYAPDYAKSAGKPLGLAHNFGDDTPSGIELTGSGYFNSVNDIHNNIAPNAVTALIPGDYSFLDYNSDGIISSADKFAIKGSDYPPITYSFSGGITYKGFDFNFLFQGDAGKYVIFNNNFWNEFVMGNYSMHIAQLDYWTPTNTDATHAALHYFSGGANNPLLSWGGGSTMDGYDIRIPDHSWRNADYIRLKDVYLGYTFDAGIVKKYMGISKMQVYATGNNLLTFTKLIEGDPERRDYRYGFYPLMMTVKLGIKLSF
jgi:TonB-linked SusC/RagA family outer membrane protein